ncbi:hypothetical protein MNV49_000740 [Pseudohyphozyma bogoriensis]|nr:hypothetical protein MNV49_000740 [Pseudohyphozyma bogoriensis]
MKLSPAAVIPKPGTVAAAALLTLVVGPKALNRANLFQKLVALLFLWNWRSWPLQWHFELFGLIPFVHLKIWRHGIKNVLSIAKDPFEQRIVTKGFVSIDVADWNGHMSNTSYGKALDKARFSWLFDVVGPAMSDHEKMWSPLGGTNYVFLKEIPVGVKYEISVNVATWDDKWIWYIARFTTAGKKPSDPRILNCLALSRSCFKLNGSRLSIPPGRILSISGLGPNEDNWNRTLQLRKEKKSRDWLFFGGKVAAARRAAAGEALSGTVTPADGAASPVKGQEGWDSDGMEVYEQRRIERLKIVQNFADTEAWAAL